MNKWKETINNDETDGINELEKHIDSLKETVGKEPVPEKPVKASKKNKTKTYVDITNLLVGLFIVMVVYLLISAYMYMGQPDMGTIYFIIVIMVGMIAWMPIGIPIGAILIDTYLRCRILRLMTKKNYGIVHIVSKGHYIITLIKNLNDSVIMKDDAIWGISKGYVYNFNKKNIKHKISSENISYISNVPVLYLDYESMKPLTFHKEDTTISPQQLGSSLVGWAMVQKKKAVRMQKQINYMYLIIAILIVVNIAISVQCLMMFQQILGGGA